METSANCTKSISKMVPFLNKKLAWKASRTWCHSWPRSRSIRHLHTVLIPYRNGPDKPLWISPGQQNTQKTFPLMTFYKFANTYLKTKSFRVPIHLFTYRSETMQRLWQTRPSPFLTFPLFYGYEWFVFLMLLKAFWSAAVHDEVYYSCVPLKWCYHLCFEYQIRYTRTFKWPKGKIYFARYHY